MTMQTEAEIVSAVQRIATALEKQNELVEKNVATQILNTKINAKIAVVLNAMSIVELKELTETINQF